MIAINSSTYLQSHEQAFAFHVRKAEIDTARVAVRIAVPDDVLDFGIDLVDESVGEALDVGMVSLQEQRYNQHMVHI